MNFYFIGEAFWEQGFHSHTNTKKLFTMGTLFPNHTNKIKIYFLDFMNSYFYVKFLQ